MQYSLSELIEAQFHEANKQMKLCGPSMGSNLCYFKPSHLKYIIFHLLLSLFDVFPGCIMLYSLRPSNPGF